MWKLKRLSIVLISIAVYSSHGAAGAGFDETGAIVFATPAKKQFSCSMCSKSFTTTSDLIKHMRTHTAKQPHRCPECNKVFLRKNALKLHMRTHTEERPYTCTECDKGFSRPDILTKHMRTHTGERPYVCAECDRGFSQKQHLTDHMLTHTGQRPYACTECGKSFALKSNLTAHRRSCKGLQIDKFEDPRILDERLKLLAARTAAVLDLNQGILAEIWDTTAAAEDITDSEDFE